jgi:imidazolonepropionase-like amidohydrolase
MEVAVYRIDAERLIPGVGYPIPDGTVVFEDDRITYADPRANVPDVAVTHNVATVMPGMWDAHGHFFGIKEARIESLFATHASVSALRAAQDAHRALMAGFTSVREVGGYGVFLARAIEEGAIVGPHIYGAGDALSPTGGHADAHAYPLDMVHQMLESKISSGICAGVPDCLKAVRKQLRLNARVITICASGGVMSEVDDPIHPQFSDEEMRAIVEEAARAERVVAAHCHGKPGMVAALNAGVKTIEHGTYLDEELAELMIEKDAILVPTRWIVEQLNVSGRDLQMPDYAYKKLIAIVDQHATAMKIAIQAGVKIAVGTDIFISGECWGTNGRELVHLVDAGMMPIGTIEAATATGPETIGAQAPLTGQLVAGFEADVITVDGNPLDDISLLADAANIAHVWKGGALVKGTTP